MPFYSLFFYQPLEHVEEQKSDNCNNWKMKMYFSLTITISIYYVI